HAQRRSSRRLRKGSVVRRQARRLLRSGAVGARLAALPGATARLRAGEPLRRRGMAALLEVAEEAPIEAQRAGVVEAVDAVLGDDAVETQALKLAAHRRAEESRLLAQCPHVVERLHLLLQRAVEGDLRGAPRDLRGETRHAVLLLGADLHQHDVAGLAVDDELAQRRIGAEGAIPVPLA